MNEALQNLHDVLNAFANNPEKKDQVRFVVTQKVYDLCLKLHGPDSVKDFIVSSQLKGDRGVNISKIIVDESI